MVTITMTIDARAAVGVAAAIASAAVLYRLLRKHTAIPLINGAAAWAAASARNKSPPGFAFYSSVTDSITTNPNLFTVSIDDHCIVRGHAVFDTCSLINEKMYRLQIHLQRLFSSAAAARLRLPFGDDLEVNRQRMTAIVAAACRASGQPTADVRFWLTAGTGNLGVTPKGCTPRFYVLVFGGLPMDPKWAVDGIPEVVISPEVVPTKPKLLAELKSNNYLLNAMTMMAAGERGGTFGLVADSDGVLLESCVLNIVVIGRDGVLRTPTFENALAGTTVRRVMDLAKRSLVSAVADGRQAASLRGVSQQVLTLADAREAAEIFLCAGDTHLFPITTLDGRPVGDGRIGPIARTLGEMLLLDAREGAEHHQSIFDH